MTPDEADVNVITQMIDLMVGVPKFSYPARQRGAPKPAEEFAHVRVLEEYQEGIPAEYTYAQDELTTTLRTYSLVKLRVRVGVVDTTGIPSSKIMNNWTTEDMKALMISSGYGFIRITPISSEDGKLENEWEYRKGFSLELYTTRVFEEVINNINSVSISGRFVTNWLQEITLNINV